MNYNPFLVKDPFQALNETIIFRPDTCICICSLNKSMFLKISFKKRYIDRKTSILYIDSADLIKHQHDHFLTVMHPSISFQKIRCNQK